MATSASPFPVSPSPMDFRNSSWDRSLTARIRAFSAAGWLDPRRAGDAGDGLRAVGDVQHHDNVRAAVPLRLVPGDGLAAVRPDHGALVVAERSAAGLSRCGTARITSAAAFRRCCSLLGMAWFNDWHAALYMPAFGAILLAIFAFAMMRDTPQSCGLPPIEEYKNDYPDDYSEKHEEELTAKQIFMQYILPEQAAVVHRYR